VRPFIYTIVRSEQSTAHRFDTCKVAHQKYIMIFLNYDIITLIMNALLNNVLRRHEEKVPTLIANLFLLIHCNVRNECNIFCNLAKYLDEFFPIILVRVFVPSDLFQHDELVGSS
jgi:hypothetical protein